MTISDSAHGLRRRALVGFFWAYGSFLAGKVLALVATLVLVRLLAPDEFGLLALSLAILAYTSSLTDIGISAALVQRADARQPDTSSTVFWVGLAGASILVVIAWFAAPLVEELGSDSRMIWIFRALSFDLLLGMLGVVPLSLLTHSLEYRKLFAPELSSGLVKGALSIGLALAGAGVWALVIGQLAGTLIRTVLLWIAAGWRPRLVFAYRKLGPMLRFGIGITAVQILAEGIRNLDYLIIGAKLGATALGLYYLAFRLPDLIVVSLLATAWDVLFPFYSRVKDADEHDGLTGDGSTRRELVDAYRRTVRLGSLLAFPLGFGIAALALPLTLTLYGEPWRDSAVPMAFIAIWAALLGVAGMPGTILKATGRAGLLTWMSAAYLVVLAPALWFAADHGISAVAAAHVCVVVFYLVLGAVIVARLLDFAWWRTFQELAPGFLLAVTAAAVVAPISLALPPIPALVAGSLAGVLVYVLLIRVFAEQDFRSLITVARSLFERRRAGGSSTAHEAVEHVR
jgi:lipopolysaccharide exporter